MAIRESVARLVLEAEVLKARDAQLVADIVSLDCTHKSGEPQEWQKINLELYEILHEHSDDISASLVPSERGDFAMFCTLGALSRAAADHTGLRLLERVKSEMGKTVSVGFGVAPTANLSQINAYTALRLSQEHGGNCAHLLF